jgi:hypothetical protein
MRLSEKRLRVQLLIVGTMLFVDVTGAMGQPAGYVVIAGAGQKSADQEKTSSIQPPGDSSSFQEIPDASAVPVEQRIFSRDSSARPMTEAEKNVRVVGPKFFPDPEEAINLRAPARTRAR